MVVQIGFEQRSTCVRRKGCAHNTRLQNDEAIARGPAHTHTYRPAGSRPRVKGGVSRLLAISPPDRRHQHNIEMGHQSIATVCAGTFQK